MLAKRNQNKKVNQSIDPTFNQTVNQIFISQNTKKNRLLENYIIYGSNNETNRLLSERLNETLNLKIKIIDTNSNFRINQNNSYIFICSNANLNSLIKKLDNSDCNFIHLIHNSKSKDIELNDAECKAITESYTKITFTFNTEDYYF